MIYNNAGIKTGFRFNFDNGSEVSIRVSVQLKRLPTLAHKFGFLYHNRCMRGCFMAKV